MSHFLRTVVVVAGIGALAACGDDAPDENALPDGCDPTTKACTVEHDFGDITLMAGEEGTVTNSGPCALLGLPFDQDKGGGRPPQ